MADGHAEALTPMEAYIWNPNAKYWHPTIKP